MAGDPIGVFGVTVDQVYGLCPEAERVSDANQSGLNTPITEATVEQWITDVAAAVSAGIGPWTGLLGNSRDQVLDAGRTVVADGAASYLEAARYPTRASLNDSTYSGVLWERHKAGLAALKVKVTELVDTGGGTGDVSSGGIAAQFPPTHFCDEVLW